MTISPDAGRREPSSQDSAVDERPADAGAVSALPAATASGAPGRHLRRLWDAAAVLTLAWAAILVAAEFVRPAGIGPWLLDFGEVPLGLAGLLLGIAVVAVDGRPQARAAWAMVALAVGANTLGNLVYGLHDMAGESPFPSLADVFYLAFYPLLLCGLMLLPTASRRRDLLDWRAASNIAIVIIGGGMVVLHFMLAPVIPELGGDPLTSVILLAYPVGDLALLAALATVTTRRPVAGDQRPVTLIGGVVAVWLAADVLYAVLTAGGQNPDTTVTDLLYIAGDVGLVLAARAGLAQQWRLDPHEPLAAPEGTRAGPYLMLALGLATMVAASVVANVEIATLAVMAVCLTGLVVARQLVDERDRRRADALLLEAHRAAALEAERRARQDPLTGLANRVELDELLRSELAASAPSGRPVTIAFMDLNAFKAVNDTLGHAAGDELLAAVGRRLARAVRSSDTVVRLGGDEFAIVLPGVDGARALDIVARVAGTLEDPFTIAGTTVRAGGAFGLATSRGLGAADLDALLSRADTAMYRAKRGGLGPSYFDPEVDQTPSLAAHSAASPAAIA